MAQIIPVHGCKKQIKLPSKAKTELNEQLVLNSFSITCSSCGNIGKFNPDGIIFRVLEYYCAACGQKHTVVNPAFSKK